MDGRGRTKQEPESRAMQGEIAEGSGSVTRVPCLDLDHLKSQIDSPRFIQRLPKLIIFSEVYNPLGDFESG